MPHLKPVIHKSLRLKLNPKSIVLLSAMLFALCALPLPVAIAASVTLGWDSNPEPDLEGYVVYRNVGSPGPPYDHSDDLREDELADPLHPKVTLTGLMPDAEYYIALTAYNTDGVESDFSDAVCVKVVDNLAAACGASAAPPVSTSPSSTSTSSSGSGGSNGGSNNGSCFISAASAQQPMFSNFPAGPASRSRVPVITLLLLVLATAVKLKKLIAHRS